MTDRGLNHYAAGAIGGSAGFIVGYPFDTIKVQLQTQEQSGDRGRLFAAISNTKKRGLVRGFYRGLSWPLLSTGFVNSIFYGVYGNTLAALEKDREKRKSAFGKIFLAGSIGGVVQAFPLIPIEYIKVVLQSQLSMSTEKAISKVAGREVAEVRFFKGPTDCAAHVIRNKGIAGLFKGTVPTFAREILFFGNYCLIYEYLSEYLKRNKLTDSRGFFADFLGGGFAGSISWLVVIPLDVIKSRYQADFRGDYSGPMDCARRSFNAEGLRVFYKGCLVTCLRGFPVCAVSFMMYSQTSQLLNKEAR